MKNLYMVVGTRPNTMKVASLYRALEKRPGLFDPVLIHTGQHYDENLNSVFLKELAIPTPDLQLFASQHPTDLIDYISSGIAKYLKDKEKSVVVVVGDVNSTYGGALGASLAGFPVAHVEAGLRSMDLRMPEEHNRIKTDKLSQFLFTTEPQGKKNLLSEGYDNKNIYFVGNTMIDTLETNLSVINKFKAYKKYHFHPRQYAVVTLHRKENFEDSSILKTLLEMIEYAANFVPIVFPLHPGSKKRIEELNYTEFLNSPNIQICEPLPYSEALSLYSQAKCVITDSGGLQDETTYFGVPCLTLRRTTERPITSRIGTSTIMGEDLVKFKRVFKAVLDGTYKRGRIPKLWDGKAGDRIISILTNSKF
jgi:UDP-N-acetylglucosamine 2-epimerase (non-hydrolysing)